MEEQDAQGSAVSRSCLQSFINLCDSLKSLPGGHRYAKQISLVDIEDELGRFRVWAGNIGALQIGHSSLEYRLQEASLVLKNLLKLLNELKSMLHEIAFVVSGERLPYDEQMATDDSDDDSLFENLQGDPDESPKTELEQNYLSIVDIIDNLYRLSIYIRNPTSRSRFSKASTFQAIDPESGVDLLSRYQEFDIEHVRHVFRYLRKDLPPDVRHEHNELIERLGKGITRRRQQFMYWRRHHDKLSARLSAKTEPVRNYKIENSQAPTAAGNIGSGPQANAGASGLNVARSEITKSAFTATTATLFIHHEKSDDVQSMISSATTARGLDGGRASLPLPPKVASGKDFECPYCFTICPAKYLNERNWRVHLLRDLQPYICTYIGCETGDQLYSSRQEWISHELHTHRKKWRCPAHPQFEYSTQAQYVEHLKQEHGHKTGDSNLQTMSEIGETTSSDTPRVCPLCLVEEPSSDRFYNHIAFHLESLASFALPKRDSASEDDSESVRTTSNDAHRGSRGSESFGPMSDFSDRPQSSLESALDERSPSSTLGQVEFGERPLHRSGFPAKYVPLFEYGVDPVSTISQEQEDSPHLSDGPNFDFKEKEVAFKDLPKSHEPDEDPEDGLFAIPVSGAERSTEEGRDGDVDELKRLARIGTSRLNKGNFQGQKVTFSDSADVYSQTPTDEDPPAPPSKFLRRIYREDESSEDASEGSSQPEDDESTGQSAVRTKPQGTSESTSAPNMVRQMPTHLASLEEPFLHAVRQGDTTAAKRIWMNSIFPRRQDYDLTDAIDFAIHAGDVLMTDMLLRIGEQNRKQWRGWSGLHNAARQGNEDLVRILLREGVKVNAKSYPDESTALHQAAKYDHYKVVRLLVDAANEEGGSQSGGIKNVEGMTPLHLAARNGSYRVVKSLVDIGHQNVAAQNNHGRTPLIEASRSGAYGVVNFLLRRKAAIDAPDAAGFTALHESVSNGHVLVIDTLLTAGANVKSRTATGSTPLHLAVVHNTETTIPKMLIEKGADVNAANENGETPLHEAAGIKYRHSIVKLLLREGANPNLFCHRGGQVEQYSALKLACLARGNIETVRLLIENGSAVNVDAENYRSALQVACHEGDIDVVSLLLENGASIATAAARFPLLNTPLEAAVSAGHLEIVNVLLDQGVDVNERSGSLGSALELACTKGHRSIAKLLIQRGAELTTGCADVSVSNGDTELLEFLIDKFRDKLGPYHPETLYAHERLKTMMKSKADIEGQDSQVPNNGRRNVLTLPPSVSISPARENVEFEDVNLFITGSRETGGPSTAPTLDSLSNPISRSYVPSTNSTDSAESEYEIDDSGNFHVLKSRKSVISPVGPPPTYSATHGESSEQPRPLQEPERRARHHRREYDENEYTSDSSNAEGVLANSPSPPRRRRRRSDEDVEDENSPNAAGVPFTPEQLNTLRNQIYAFKLLSKNLGIPPQLQQKLSAAQRPTLGDEYISRLRRQSSVDTFSRPSVQINVEFDHPSKLPRRSPTPEAARVTSPLVHSAVRQRAEEEAEAEEQQGMKSYLKGQFDAAIEHYRRAWILYKKITYLIHLSIAQDAKGDFKGAIETCEVALTRVAGIFEDSKTIAEAYSQMGTSYEKLGDLPNAIINYKNSLEQHRTVEMLEKLRTAESAQIEAEKDESRTRSRQELLQAMTRDNDRDFLLRIEQRLITFIEESSEDFFELPRGDAHEQTLIQDLANYYRLNYSSFVEAEPKYDIVLLGRTSSTRSSPRISEVYNSTFQEAEIARASVSRGPEEVSPPNLVQPPPTSDASIKGILRAPRDKFPETPAVMREGVAPGIDARKRGIPTGARWTKINRSLVNPDALSEGSERFEERADSVIVLRVLTKEEIEKYAERTQEIRDARMGPTPSNEEEATDVPPMISPGSKGGTDDDVKPQMPNLAGSGQHDSSYITNLSSLMSTIPDDAMSGEAIAWSDFSPKTDYGMPLRTGQVIEVQERSRTREGWLVVHDQRFKKGLVPETSVILTRLLNEEQRVSLASGDLRAYFAAWQSSVSGGHGSVSLQNKAPKTDRERLQTQKSSFISDQSLPATSQDSSSDVQYLQTREMFESDIKDTRPRRGSDPSFRR